MFDGEVLILKHRLPERRKPEGERTPAGGNLSFFVGRRPVREAEVRSYIIVQHRLGRRLSDILDDDYVRRYGSSALIWRALLDARTIGSLLQDIRDAMNACRP